MIRRLPLLAAAALLASTGAAHAQDAPSQGTLISALDQCRPDVARASAEELVAAAEARGWTGFQRGSIGKLPVMASIKRQDPKNLRSPSVMLGLLSNEGELGGAKAWGFTGTVETTPAMTAEIEAWAASVYPGSDSDGWAGTRAGGVLVEDGLTELLDDIQTRLATIQTGDRIIMLSISSDRNRSTAITQIFEKID